MRSDSVRCISSRESDPSCPEISRLTSPSSHASAAFRSTEDSRMLQSAERVEIAADIVEDVVRPDRLDLVKRVEQWHWVPYPHVSRRVRVGVDLCRIQRYTGGEVRLLDIAEAVREPCELNVSGNVR